MKVFENKEKLVAFVKHQTNVDLANDPNESFNKKKNILYTLVNDSSKYSVLPLFHKYGIRYEKHHKERYWVYLK